MGPGGAFLHGDKGALLRDLPEPRLRQAEAKEASDAADALAQVLRDRKRSRNQNRQRPLETVRDRLLDRRVRVNEDVH